MMIRNAALVTRRDVDLARDGGGDEGGAPFSQESNASFGGGAKRVEFRSLGADVLDDGALFLEGRKRNLDLPKALPVQSQSVPNDAMGTAPAFCAEDLSPEKQTRIVSADFYVRPSDDIVRAHQALLGSNANGALPHPHLIEDNVAPSRDLVSIEVRGCCLDSFIREFPPNHTLVEGYLEKRQIGLITLVNLPEEASDFAGRPGCRD